MSRKLRSLITLIGFFLCLSTFTSYAVGVPNEFIIDGSGFGHGVGLSQIGAKGQALSGKTAADILSYYFPGTQLTSVDDSATIRVNVGHRLSVLSAVIDKGFPKGAMQLLPGDSKNGVPALTNTASDLIDSSSVIKFSVIGKTVQAVINNKRNPPIRLTSAIFTLRWTGTESLSGAASVIVLGGNSTIRLKYGQVQIRAVPVTGQGYFLEVTDTLRLHDQYLYGISEVPSSWPAEALKTQVIASRTYALARMGKIKKECDCQIYNSKYDQNFIGYAKESEIKFGKLWKAAVDATTIDQTHSLAITYKEKLINVYFFSSSGGITQRSADVWGTDYSYLTNILDPWSVDPLLNPGYAYWERIITQSDMANAFSLPDVSSVSITKRSSANAAMEIEAISTSGETATLSVSEFKSLVHLPSSWFEIFTDEVPQSPSPSPSSSVTPTPSATPTPNS